ncbi:hypothetical protein BGW80DRAFT_1357351 [Lactifluus volemus]|nr:hypothetical protein BGW80DRAFT_1357351 [Lactifluus volemus]
MSLANIDLGPNAGQYIYLNSICNISAAAILYYEYALTLPREIQYLWPPHNKQGWFTTACLLNRYLAVIGHLPTVVSYFLSGSPTLCDDLHTFRKTLVVNMQIIAGLLCLVRVYALYSRSRRILSLLLTIGFGAIINASVMLVIAPRVGGEEILVISDIRGCNQFTPFIGGLYGALAWSGVLIFDSVVFSLTLYKALSVGRGVWLLDLIVRDGALYFSVLFIMNLINILMLWCSPPLLKNSTATLTSVLSTTLVSRLVLNLREQDSSISRVSTSIDPNHKFQAAPSPAELVVSTWDVTSIGAPDDRTKATSQARTVVGTP